MKRIILAIILAFTAVNLLAQAPKTMSYQAIIRDSNNSLVKSSQIVMQISILQGSITGSSVYEETLAPMTNSNGLVSLEIGSGTSTANFGEIDWANGPYFIRTETDPTGGSDYTIIGTSQLLSVPYALYASVADSVAGGFETLDSLDIANLGFITKDTDTQLDSTDIANFGFITEDTDTKLDSADISNMGFVAGAITSEVDGDNTNELQTFTVSNTGDTLTISGGNSIIIPGISLANYIPKIGDFLQGGVVFWIDPEDPTGKSGLVVDIYSLGSAEWGCAGTSIPGANNTNIGDGNLNTVNIIAGCPSVNIAAQICDASTNTGYSDWFLPNLQSWSAIKSNITIINQTISTNGGAPIPLWESFWSSVENDSNQAYTFLLFEGYGFQTNKSNANKVRAVRPFNL